MYMSQEEFEGYLAKQNAEPVEIAPAKKMSPNAIRVLEYTLCAIPFVMVIAACGLWSIDANRKQSDRTATWDKILGFTAASTGFEYDAEAESLEKRLTFKRKR